MASAFLPAKREVEEKIARIVEESYKEKVERLEREYEEQRRAVEESFKRAAKRFKEVIEQG